LSKLLDKLNKYKDSCEDDNFYVINDEAESLVFEAAKVIARYEKALKFYADKENYECDDSELDPSVSYIHIVDMDEGSKARKALGIEGN
jgi:hypothetical protein